MFKHQCLVFLEVSPPTRKVSIVITKDIDETVEEYIKKNYINLGLANIDYFDVVAKQESWGYFK